MAKDIKDSKARLYRRIFYLVAVLVVIGGSLLCSKTAYAYTEEEKQQAKAWLSAHGYSPDISGASQAYEDYLNGKFDEELGYDTNGDGVPAATTEDASSDSQEQSTEGNETSEKTGKGEVPSDGTMPSGNTGKTIESENEGGSKSENDTAAPEAEQRIGTDDQEGTTAAKIVEQKAIRNGNITLYCPEKKDCYQDGAMVIVLGVLAMFAVDIFIHFQR